MNNKQQIYFNPKEVRIIALGIGRIIDDINEMKKGEYAHIPWTPDTRKDFSDMMANARSVAAKLEKFTGIKCELPEYNDGDENEFLTKES